MAARSGKPGMTVGAAPRGRVWSPGSAQYTSSRPRSASGSPRVHSSQSSTARTRPAGERTTLSRRKSPCTIRAGPPWSGGVAPGAAVDLVEPGRGPGRGLLELALPAGELAFQVAVVAAEPAEPDLVGVDPVEGHQGVDQRVGGPAARRLVQGGGHGG